MIAIHNADTGEGQHVASLDGYGEEWSQVGPELPTGIDPETLLLIDGEWVANLPLLRAQRWQLIRAARDAARSGGCESAIGRVDTTADSLVLANGASSAAMAAAAAGEAFAIGWTRADNVTVPIDGPQMIAVGLAIVAHVGACHAEGVARRAALDAAQDEAAIAAVPIAGGWPGE